MSASVARTTAAVLAFTAAFAVSYTPATRAQTPNPPGPSNPTRIVSETDLDVDGTYDVVITRDFTYQGGNAVQVVTTFDGNSIVDADGTPDQIQIQMTVFNARGNPSEDIVYIDSLADSSIDQKRIVDYSYDGRGNLILRVDDLYNYSTNAKLQHNTMANTWANRGNLLAQILTFDIDGINLENRGNLLTQVLEFDFNNDGVVNRRQTTTNNFDLVGNLINNTFEVDTDGNGTVDQRNDTTIQRRLNGQVKSQVTTIDNPSDGTIDEVRTISNLIYAGVGGNTILQLTTERDTAPLGPPVVWRSVTSNSYDNHGLRTGIIVAYDIGADGTVDNTLVTTLNYDQRGNLTQTVADVDIDADGFANQGARVTYTY